MGKQILNGIIYGTGEIIKFSPEIYSLEEREVGVWTDGKPLYQKSFSIPASTTTGDNTFTIPLGLQDVDKVIDYNVIIIPTGTNRFARLPLSLDTKPISTQNEYSFNLQYYDKTTDTLRIDIGSLSSHQGGHGSIWYTKTTDTPGSGHYTIEGDYPREVPIHLSSQLFYIGPVTTQGSRVNFYCDYAGNPDTQHMFLMPMSIPSGYHVEYRLSALMLSEGPHYAQLYINDVKMMEAVSWTGNASSFWNGHYGHIVYSELFRFSDIPTEAIYLYTTGGRGFNFNLRGSASGFARVENVMLHAYLVRDI